MNNAFISTEECTLYYYENEEFYSIVLKKGKEYKIETDEYILKRAVFENVSDNSIETELQNVDFSIPIKNITKIEEL